MTVIYIDILLVINLTVDYLVLFGTARLCGMRFERVKGLCGAIVGAVFSLVILIDMPKFIFALLKLSVSILMITITFGKRKFLEMFRTLMIFYICGFLFSGFMMMINSAVHADSFLIKGGVLYFEFSAMETVISGTAAFIITEILHRIFRRGEPEGIFIVKIYFGGKCAVLNGFTDTGNNLSDPISGTPVAVAPEKPVEKILPEKMFEAMKNMDMSTEYNFRIIPCKTVTGSVLTKAFRPEKFVVINENGEYEAEEILIAISENVPENTLIVGKNILLNKK